MKQQIFNENNLKNEDIDEVVTRVKAFVINDKNEILLAFSNGGVQLVGGHVEKGEDSINALVREIKEEAGIIISKENVFGPFYEINHYMKNYFNSSKNVIAKMLYYKVKTDKEPDFSLINRTKQEEKYNFDIRFVSFDDFEKLVNECCTNEKEINRVIASEMKSAFNTLKSEVL